MVIIAVTTLAVLPRCRVWCVHLVATVVPCCKCVIRILRDTMYLYCSEGVFRMCWSFIGWEVQGTRPCQLQYIIKPAGGGRGSLLLFSVHSLLTFCLSVLWVFLTTFDMWLVAVSIPLFPTIIVAFIRYNGHITALCRHALAWTLRVLLRTKVCVRSTHAYVFTNCTHGKADSVLETFDLYANTHPSLSISPQMCEYASEFY